MIIPEPSPEVKAVIDYLNAGNEIVRCNYPECSWYEIEGKSFDYMSEILPPQDDEPIAMTIARGLFAEDFDQFIGWEDYDNFEDRAIVMTLDERIALYRQWLWSSNILRTIGYSDLADEIDANNEKRGAEEKRIKSEAHKRIDAFIRGESDNRNIT